MLVFLCLVYIDEQFNERPYQPLQVHVARGKIKCIWTPVTLKELLVILEAEDRNEHIKHAVVVINGVCASIL